MIGCYPKPWSHPFFIGYLSVCLGLTSPAQRSHNTRRGLLDSISSHVAGKATTYTSHKVPECLIDMAWLFCQAYDMSALRCAL